MNQYPERDTLGINFKNQYKNVTPGNNNFNEAVCYGRKTYVLDTSMVKGIRRNEFNSHLRKCNTRFRPFIGATVKQMETYVQPIVCDDTPDAIILHIGCNDISNRSMSANDIAEGIIKVGKYCKEHNVNDAAISSLICRSQFHLQQKINAVNTMLKNRCKLFGLGFIDNSLSNANKVIVGNININSLSAKFDQVKKVILKHVDILVITETKLDDTFPLAQLYVDGFSKP